MFIKRGHGFRRKARLRGIGQLELRNEKEMVWANRE
jgi:hypothetical protein